MRQAWHNEKKKILVSRVIIWQKKKYEVNFSVTVTGKYLRKELKRDKAEIFTLSFLES